MIVFTAAAGNTIPANNPMNPPSISPSINTTTLRNTVPLINVPTAVKIGALIVVGMSLLTERNSIKKHAAVTGLSIKLAICPPGAAVVNAEITPVTIASIAIYFGLGNSKIPKNIIDNNISGFTPNKIGGTTACKTAPIPTNNDKITKTLVFNCISPLLNSAILLPNYTLIVSCRNLYLL